jgi:hypothetical protein
MLQGTPAHPTAAELQGIVIKINLVDLLACEIILTVATLMNLMINRDL